MGLFDRLRPPDEPGSGDPTAVAAAHFERGKHLFFGEGNWREAARAFEAAARLVPESVDSQFLLGAALLRAGDTDASVGPLRACLELEPEHADGRNALGMALGRLGQEEEADRQLARAAYLGHEQAPQTLAAMRMDFCRRCAAPVKVGEPSDADVIITTPAFGLECHDCRTILCGACGTRNGATVSPPCPECGGDLAPLMR